MVLNLNSSVRKVKRLPSCLWLMRFLSEGAEPTERYSGSGQECNWVRIADLALFGPNNMEQLKLMGQIFWAFWASKLTPIAINFTPVQPFLLSFLFLKKKSF